MKVALEACGITQGPVVVLNGDLPLITADTVAKFAQTVATGELACTVMTMTPPDPFGYGRIKLGADGQIERIIEQKDCTPEQAATLLECNAGCYAFDGAQLAAHIDEIGNDNAQSEYYLPDMLEILKGHGQAVSIFHCDDYRDGLGVNSRIQLAQLTAIARDRINEHWMAEGVPSSTHAGLDRPRRHHRPRHRRVAADAPDRPRHRGRGVPARPQQPSHRHHRRQRLHHR